MTLPVLICDDSALARRQMARALPSHWDISLSFASNGEEALQAVREGKADLMFLDLNMPVMNGYQVLEQIRLQDLPTMVLVVSGDVQTEAYQRVMSKGALDFIRKPVTAAQIQDILERYGILDQNIALADSTPAPREEQLAPAFLEALREVTNVAMGQAGSHLSVLLDSFIQLPVPDVFICTYDQLHQLLSFSTDNQGSPTSLCGVSHGFRGNGVAGEGILLLKTDDVGSLQSLVRREVDESIEHNKNSSIAGVLSDLSELLVGACLKGISQQLDLDFNHSYPALLGAQQDLPTLLDTSENSEQVLTVSISYYLNSPEIQCNLLLLFTEDSISALKARVELLSSGQQESLEAHVLHGHVS